MKMLVLARKRLSQTTVNRITPYLLAGWDVTIDYVDGKPFAGTEIESMQFDQAISKSGTFQPLPLEDERQGLTGWRKEARELERDK